MLSISDISDNKGFQLYVKNKSEYFLSHLRNRVSDGRSTGPKGEVQFDMSLIKFRGHKPERREVILGGLTVEEEYAVFLGS